MDQKRLLLDYNYDSVTPCTKGSYLYHLYFLYVPHPLVHKKVRVRFKQLHERKQHVDSTDNNSLTKRLCENL